MSALRDFAVGRKRPVTVDDGAALWRGEIVEVLSNGLVWVVVPRMGGEDPIGPISTVAADFAKGDRVLVGAVGGDVSDLIVIARL